MPESRKKSKQSRKNSLKENSSHPRTPQSIITPKHIQNVSPNF